MIELQESSKFRPFRRVCDIGSSQIYCSGAAASLVSFFESFKTSADLPKPSDSDFNRMADLGYARELWERCGIEYTCIDTSAESEAIPLDLNFDRIPGYLAGRHDLVINIGTTEHVANQVNAFKIIHDLTAVGGLMYHAIPFQGFQTHGLVNYTPKFFWMLCRSNGYDYLQLDISQDFDFEPLHPDIQQSLALLNRPDHTKAFGAFNSSLRFVLRRSSPHGFVPPFDGHVGGTINGLPESYHSMFPPRRSFPSLQSLASASRQFFRTLFP